MHEKIAIITDSGSDVPKTITNQDNVVVAPMQINWDNESLRDRVDITPKEFYQRLKKEKNLPKTSSPQTGEIIKQINKLKQKGYTHLLVICISSNLSTSYSQIYQQAKASNDFVVEGIDTKNVGIGSGQIAVYAEQLIQKGYSFAQIVPKLKQSVIDSRIFFYVPTLKYLMAGGRIGKVAGILGSALHIKPIISCNPEGIYYPIAKARGEKKAIKKMIELVDNIVEHHKQVRLAICDGDNQGLRNKLVELMRHKYLNLEIDVGNISPALGVHTGPGLIGMAVNVRNDI